MLPPDDVLVAHLTLLGFVGWHDEIANANVPDESQWSLWFDGRIAWWANGQAHAALWADTEWFDLRYLDEFPRPLLHALAEKLLEISNAAA